MKALLTDIFKRTNLKPGTITILFALLSMGLTGIHMYQIDFHTYKQQIELHKQIIQGTAPKPYNERVLLPISIEKSINFITSRTSVPYDALFVLFYSLIKLASIFVTMVYLQKIFNYFNGYFFSLAGTLLFAMIMPLTFNCYYYQPTSSLELACFAVCIYLINLNRNMAAVYLLLGISTLNRNTSVFIILYYLLWNAGDILANIRNSSHGKNIPYLRNLAIMSFIWLAIILSLKHFYPGGDWVNGPVHYLIYNFLSKNSPRVLIYSFMVTWPVLISTFCEWNNVAARHKILALWGAAYVCLHFAMAQCDETRYWLPLYMVYAPFLGSLFCRLKETEDFTGCKE